MLPKDKYTLFDKKEKTYRKGIHSTFVSTLSLTCSQGGCMRMLTIFFKNCPSGQESASA